MNLSKTVECIKANLEYNDNSEINISNSLDWAKKYYFINDKPYESYNYLREILEDDYKDIVIQKSAQMGVSEIAIIKAFYFLETKFENIFYAFPHQGQLTEFVRGRVNPRIEESPYLRKNITQTDNIGQKQFKNKFLYFRGATSRAQIISVDAGFLICDEVDEMKQASVATMFKRLGASKYAYKMMLSTPTYEDYGINFEYRKTDQREWHVQCEECGKWQTLDFFQNIAPKPTREVKEYNFVCRHCGTVIDNKKDGKWIPRFPDRERKGYHISKMMTETASNMVKMYFEAQDKGELAIKEFYNSDLGEPYVVKGGKLTEQDLNACREDRNPPIRSCYMGIDVGSMLNVVITKPENEINYRVYVGVVKDFRELDRLMKEFDVSRCVVDALPETREAKAFAKRFDGRVYLAFYNLNEKSEICRFDREKSVVRINRTLAMDATAHNVLIRKTRFPYSTRGIPGFYEQMKAPQRVEELNEKTGNLEYSYLEGNKPDHYYHANVYCDVAMSEQRPFSFDSGSKESGFDDEDLLDDECAEYSLGQF